MYGPVFGKARVKDKIQHRVKSKMSGLIDREYLYMYRIGFLYNTVGNVVHDNGEYTVCLNSVYGSQVVVRTGYLDEMFQSYERDGYVIIDSCHLTGFDQRGTRFNFRKKHDEGIATVRVSPSEVEVNGVTCHINKSIFVHKMEKI